MLQSAAADGLLAEAPPDDVDVAGSGGQEARHTPQQAELRKNVFKVLNPLVPDLSVDQLPVILSWA